MELRPPLLPRIWETWAQFLFVLVEYELDSSSLERTLNPPDFSGTRLSYTKVWERGSVALCDG